MAEAPYPGRGPSRLVPVLLVVASFVTVSVVAFQLATIPPPPTFTMAIDSQPPGVSFSIDGVKHTTPFNGSLVARSHTIIMPSHAVIDGVTYNFQRWSDGPADRSRGFVLQGNRSFSASFVRTVATLPVASDSYAATFSLSTNGGKKFLADSLGHPIVVYINGQGQVAVTVNHGDPMKDAWNPPFVSPRGFSRPAAVLLTDDEMHVVGEFQSSVRDLVVHLSRDPQGHVTGATFDPAIPVEDRGGYASAVRAHDGSIWAVWNRWDGPVGAFTASRLVAGHWTPGNGWTKQVIAIDTGNTERFYPIIIERPDNFKLYVFANRGEGSPDRRFAFVSAPFSNGNWTWGGADLSYETIASRGITDSVDAAWDPIRNRVVVVNDHTGTPSYFAFTLDANDVKTHFDTPDFAIVNNDWGSILVDSASGDYYLLFMETYGAAVGRACYTRWHGGLWSDFVVLDENPSDAAFRPSSVPSSHKDVVFARGSVTGSVEIRYARIP
ncbi:MAG: hypothetical protein E6K12_04245 [Methanobacteriota archaeon]|nr:MAG: hypothetical protein E6K12_04245 [Euryarchaeota archaeon]